MSTQDKIDVMQAWMDGHEIESRCRTKGNDGQWRIVADPNWNWRLSEYRVMEEEAEPVTDRLHERILAHAQRLDVGTHHREKLSEAIVGLQAQINELLRLSKDRELRAEQQQAEVNKLKTQGDAHEQRLDSAYNHRKKLNSDMDAIKVRLKEITKELVTGRDKRDHLALRLHNQDKRLVALESEVYTSEEDDE